MSTSIDGTNGITFPNSSTQSQSAGMGTSATAQTWQNVTSSRALGTTYTNSTGYPIMVAVSQSSTASGGFGGAFSINGTGLPQNYSYASGSGYITLQTYIVPNGATYSCASNATTLNSWFELR